MSAEGVLDIVLSSLVVAMHLFAVVSCLVWRIKKFHKGLHHSIVGLLVLLASLYLGVFLPIGGFTFLDGGTSGTKSLLVATLFCPALLSLYLHECCFCIYLDDSVVVKRTLFSETRIDLMESKSLIDDTGPFPKYFRFTIESLDNKTIQFITSHIEGDLMSFLRACKEAQKGRGKDK